MAMNFTALSYYKETLISLPAKYSSGRFLLTSCLPNHAFGYTKRFHPHFCFTWLAMPPVYHFRCRRMNLAASSSTDGSGTDPSGSNSNSSTRLFRFFQTFQTKLGRKIKELKKGLWMKVLFFLVGFYCATAFATVIGQTGDWDILSAGLAVVLVEGIGALMYRASHTYFKKLRHLITIFNFWKAGLSLGLFLDAFKYDIDLFLESCNPLKFEIDISEIFWSRRPWRDKRPRSRPEGGTSSSSTSFSLSFFDVAGY